MLIFIYSFYSKSLVFSVTFRANSSHPRWNRPEHPSHSTMNLFNHMVICSGNKQEYPRYRPHHHCDIDLVDEKVSSVLLQNM